MTAANYSNNDYYHYAYDAVGNRETQQSLVGRLSSNVSYQSDDANRLTSVNAVSYSWENNGNLLNDGVNTYTYDSTNRLVQVSDQSLVTHLSYSGHGQRLSMDAAGVIAHDVMDGDQRLVADSACTTTFCLYGQGAISEGHHRMQG